MIFSDTTQGWSRFTLTNTISTAVLGKIYDFEIGSDNDQIHDFYYLVDVMSYLESDPNNLNKFEGNGVDTTTALMIRYFSGHRKLHRQDGSTIQDMWTDVDLQVT